MSINVTLNPVGDLTNTTTAQTTINTNSTALTAALQDGLSRTGQTPNQMTTSIDMNANRILNVAAAINAGDAVNLQALSTITGGGKVSNIPVGGTTGQLLAKTSNADFALGYVNPANVTAGTNINVASGVISTVPNPVFTTVNGNTITAGTGTLTVAAGKTLNVQNSITLAGTDGTTQTLPTTSGTLLSSSSPAGGNLTGTYPNPTVASNAITNAQRAQMTAFTIKGNPTGSTANETDFTIPSLTQKATPVGADTILLVDSAASNALKFATVASIGTSSGVSSIAGNTGAFTLTNGITNSTNAIGLTAGRLTLPTVQKFLSGSGTYTTPANCLWIEVELVGAGGGGGGSGTTGNTAGGAGGATTFGTTLLSGGGGAGGAAVGGSPPATGGTASLGSGPIGTAIAGGAGVGPSVLSAGLAQFILGGTGASSPFGGAGASTVNGAGTAAIANSGSGGGGGGTAATASDNSGGGGGAGGYVKAIINTPLATYAYAVGAAGTAGTSGTGGFAGSTGGSGYIIVWEHYGS